jgi:hypothetical protein
MRHARYGHKIFFSILPVRDEWIVHALNDCRTKSQKQMRLPKRCTPYAEEFLFAGLQEFGQG